MKLLIFIPLFILSCSTSRPVLHDGLEHIQDTAIVSEKVFIQGQHIHYKEMCVSFNDTSFHYIDTLYLEYYIPLK